MTDEAPKAGGYEAEKILEAWLIKQCGFPSIDRRRGATGLAVVEKGGELCRFSQKRDYFGCIDVTASSDDVIWFIQVTTKAGLAKRRRKVAAVTWPSKAILAGNVRVSVLEHSIPEKRGREWLHRFSFEDWRPRVVVTKVGGTEEKHYDFSFVKAGSYDFTLSELARDEREPVAPGLADEARRIAALPKEEREVAIARVAAERKAARRAKK